MLGRMVGSITVEVQTLRGHPFNLPFRRQPANRPQSDAQFSSLQHARYILFLRLGNLPMVADMDVKTFFIRLFKQYDNFYFLCVYNTYIVFYVLVFVNAPKDLNWIISQIWTHAG